MSDIQPTEVDKESIFDTIYMMCVAGEPRVARAEFGRYEAFVRADAVKAEREMCIGKAKKLIVSVNRNNKIAAVVNASCNSTIEALIKLILSDD